MVKSEMRQSDANGLLKYCTCNFMVPSFAKLSIIFFSNFHFLFSKKLFDFCHSLNS